MTYHLCTLEHNGWLREEWVAYRTALVGNFFRLGKDRWTIVSVSYPGVSEKEAWERK